jgi:HSP20 family protein
LAVPERHQDKEEKGKKFHKIEREYGKLRTRVESRAHSDGEGFMANIATRQKDSIVDQLEQLHQRIARRAYDLFRSRDGWGDAFGDWLRAEQELVWKPAVELREQDGTFAIAAALPGVDAKDISVDITPQEVVIKAATQHSHTEDKGQVHCCEFTAGQVFRSLAFPKAVDATKAKADYQNGMLNITVPIVPEARAKRVDIKAA